MKKYLVQSTSIPEIRTSYTTKIRGDVVKSKIIASFWTRNCPTVVFNQNALWTNKMTMKKFLRL